MHKNLRIIALCLVLACAAFVMAEDGTVEVRVYDTQGNLVTNGTLMTRTEAGDMAKYLPRPDGVFEINAAVGDKIEFTVGTPTFDRTAIKYNEIVPASEQINLQDAAVDAPANDDCTDAIPVAPGTVVAGTTLGSTDDGVDSCVTFYSGGQGVWYEVTGTGNEMSATTCPDWFPGAGATYDTKISVWCGDCEVPTCVTGNDDVSCSQTFRSGVTWCSQLGATYLIQVHGFFGYTGDFDLAVYESGGLCEPDVQCLPEGACCTCLDEPFNCEVTTQGECLAKGGIPRGGGTNCLPLLGDPIAYVAFPGLSITGPPVSDTITVAESFPIGDVNIDLGITHTWVSDMEISISHNGLTQLIWNNNCGSSDNINATSDDQGTETSCAAIGAGPIDSVFFSPVVGGMPPLANYNGMDSAGDWTIEIIDVFPFGDDGVLNQWSVHIDGVGTPPCELNVTLCHYPDEGAPHTIVVGESSVPAHLNHGDELGACEGDGGSDGGSFGN
jgi:subtilisin-like proprotein convertase family protein